MFVNVQFTVVSIVLYFSFCCCSHISDSASLVLDALAIVHHYSVCFDF